MIRFIFSFFILSVVHAQVDLGGRPIRIFDMQNDSLNPGHIWLYGDDETDDWNVTHFSLMTLQSKTVYRARKLSGTTFLPQLINGTYYMGRYDKSHMVENGFFSIKKDLTLEKLLVQGPSDPSFYPLQPIALLDHHVLLPYRKPGGTYPEYTMELKLFHFDQNKEMTEIPLPQFPGGSYADIHSCSNAKGFVIAANKYVSPGFFQENLGLYYLDSKLNVETLAETKNINANSSASHLSDKLVKCAGDYVLFMGIEDSKSTLWRWHRKSAKLEKLLQDDLSGISVDFKRGIDMDEKGNVLVLLSKASSNGYESHLKFFNGAEWFTVAAHGDKFKLNNGSWAEIRSIAQGGIHPISSFVVLPNEDVVFEGMLVNLQGKFVPRMIQIKRKNFR